MKRLMIVAPLMAALAGPALAQQTAATGNAATAQLNSVDRQFVSAAASGGIAEVQTAQLAEQQSSKSQVKSFAQKMIDDHTKANQQLASLASQMGVTPPTEPDAKGIEVFSLPAAGIWTAFRWLELSKSFLAHPDPRPAQCLAWTCALVVHAALLGICLSLTYRAQRLAAATA